MSSFGNMFNIGQTPATTNTAAPTTSAPLFSFGNTPQAPNLSFNIGAPNTAPTTTPSMFNLGAQSLTSTPGTLAQPTAFGNTAPVQPFSFGSANLASSNTATATTNAPLFNFGSTPQAPNLSFNIGNSNTTAVTTTTPSASTATSTPSMFNLGAQSLTGGPATLSQPIAFGNMAPALPASFGVANPPVNLASTSTATATTNAPLFSFGSTPQAPNLSFNTGTSNTTATSTTVVTTPTTTVATTASPSMFNLGAQSITSTPVSLQQPTVLSSTATPASSASFGSASGATTTSIFTKPATVPTSSAPPISRTMTFRQLEDQINIWTNELNQLESDFHSQAQTINSWDSLLINNAVKITLIDETVEKLKTENLKLDRQLDFVVAQQNELEQLLEPLEKMKSENSSTDIVNNEREATYNLVETVQNDLQSIGDDLHNFIKRLNDTSTEEDATNPIYQIEMVLNAQMDALQWIESQVHQRNKLLSQ